MPREQSVRIVHASGEVWTSKTANLYDVYTEDIAVLPPITMSVHLLEMEGNAAQSV